jgi:hypothetical protein
MDWPTRRPSLRMRIACQASVNANESRGSVIRLLKVGFGSLADIASAKELVRSVPFADKRPLPFSSVSAGSHY